MSFIIDGILREKESLLVVAPPRMGLTHFLVQMAVSVSEGSHFLNLKTTLNEINFLSAEMGEEKVGRLMDSYDLKRGDSHFISMPYVYKRGDCAPIRYSGHNTGLIAKCAAKAGDVAILDGIDILCHNTLDPELAEIIVSGQSTIIASCRTHKNKLGDTKPLTRGSGLSRLFDTTMIFKRAHGDPFDKPDHNTWKIEVSPRTFPSMSFKAKFNYPKWERV